MVVVNDEIFEIMETAFITMRTDLIKHDKLINIKHSFNHSTFEVEHTLRLPGKIQ